MENVLRDLADDIAIGLVNEWRRRKAVPVSPAPKVHDMLVEQLARELVSRQDDVRTRTSPQQQTLLDRLEQVESTLGKIASRIRSGQGEYEDGSDCDGDSSKYQNVESFLKYVDSPGSEGGVKLVIMNFND